MDEGGTKVIASIIVAGFVLAFWFLVFHLAFRAVEALEACSRIN
jgi:hypothetical protein